MRFLTDREAKYFTKLLQSAQSFPRNIVYKQNVPELRHITLDVTSERFYYQKTLSFSGFIIILFLISQSPSLLMSLLVIFNIIPFLQLLPDKANLKILGLRFLTAIIDFFWAIGFLTFLFKFYDFIYYQLPLHYFKILTVLLHSGTLLYIISIRYLVFLRIEGLSIPWWAYLCYICSIVFGLLRSAVSLSTFIIPYTLTMLPDYYIDHTDIPEGLQEPSSQNDFGFSKRLFFFGRHNHHYHQERAPLPSSAFFRYSGLILGGISVCLTGYACYQYSLSAQAAIIAANAAVASANVAEVANDLTRVVDLKLMTPEQFLEKYPLKK